MLPISVYLPSNQSAPYNAKLKSGWQRYKIFRDRGFVAHLADVCFLKLSDGRIVVTNDFHSGDDSPWVPSVPNGELTGQQLSTRVCQPRSNQALSALFQNLVVLPADKNHANARWKVKKDGSDSDAYIRYQRFRAFHELPAVTKRQFTTTNSSECFSTPENAIITHVKIGSAPLKAFRGPTQLESVDPSKTPVFLLYTEDSTSALQEGDSIDSCYLYNFPEWFMDTWIRNRAALPHPAPPAGMEDDAHYSDDERLDSLEDDYEEEFTPYSGTYFTGNGEQVFAFAGEGPDFTACDSECGYCGRCQY